MTNRSKWLTVLALLLAGLALIACGPAQTEEAAESSGQATEEPGEMEAATEAPTAEEMTQEPTAEEMTTEAPSGEQVTLTLWHGYIETEEQTFSQVTQQFNDSHPNITVELLAVPFDELQNKFQTEVAAGSGPTLITGPQDRMAGYHEAGLLATLPEDAAFLNDLVPAAVDGGYVGGDFVGVPINNKVVAMFYNTSMIDTPPADFDELLTMAADNGLAITADWFHNYMWGPAFGAQFFDDNYKVVIDSEAGASAYAYFKQVCESDGVTCDPNDGDMDTLFRQGEVAFRFQGPWMAGDAIADLGEENVAVTAIPQIPGEDFPRPWNQSEMISVNVDATDAEMAAVLEYIAYLTSADVQATFLEQANWIPSNASVDTSSNPVVGGFLDQVPYSDPFPVVTELGATWDPMGNAMVEILEGVKDPQQALSDAAALINEQNGK
jgi:arabinogalactan oligomer/maltooligosaccharide transport system substrate-binding protein